MSDYRCVSDSSSREFASSIPARSHTFVEEFWKKSADEIKSMINYLACNELTPFQPNCFVLNAINVCCRYSRVIQTSLLSWSWMQSLWTRIRLILREQSYLGLLQYLIPKNIFRQNGRGISVWLVGKGVNLCISHVQQIRWKVLSWAL